MTIWPMSFRRIMTLLLTMILVIIVAFLLLSTWSFQAFSTFIETDQRQELVLGRLYERLMDHWFEMGNLVKESFLQGQPLPGDRKEDLLEAAASISAAIDAATTDHPRRQFWETIRESLGSYTADLRRLDGLMSDWAGEVQRERQVRLEWRETFMRRVGTLTLLLAQMPTEPGTASPEASLRQMVQAVLETLDGALATNPGPSRPGLVSPLSQPATLAAWDTLIESRFQTISLLVPAVTTVALGLIPPDLAQTLTREAEDLQRDFQTFREHVQTRQRTFAAMDRELGDLYESLRDRRAAGVDLCVTESDVLWEAIEGDAERLLADIRVKFGWRFAFLALSLVIALLGLALLPPLLGDPVDRLRRRFLDLQPGEPPSPAPPCIVTEFEDLDRSFLAMVGQVNQHIRLQDRYFQTITRIRQIFSTLYEVPTVPGEAPGITLGLSIHRLLDLLGSQMPDLTHAQVFRVDAEDMQPLGNAFVPPSVVSGARPVPAIPPERHQAIAAWLWANQVRPPLIVESPEGTSPEPLPMTPAHDLPPELRPPDGAAAFLGIRLPRQGRTAPGGPIDGLLYLVISPAQAHLRPADHLFLSIIAQNLATLLDIAGLLAISQKEREMSFQLRIAKEIQEGALPTGVPQTRELRVEAQIRMASEVGGDYYDFFPGDDGRLGLLIADVSGKNVSAALLTMVLRATLHSLPVRSFSPKALVSRLSRVLRELLPPSHFITLVFAIVDPARAQVTLCSAGHTPALLVSGTGASSDPRSATASTPPATVQVLSYPALPLGLSEDHHYEEQVVPFRRGDRLVLFTDGVTDARNPRGESFGQDRLEALLASFPHAALPELADHLARFQEGTPPADDLTLLLVEYREVPGFTPAPADAMLRA
ncbi:MAG: serine/threonine-protein phosphatase [Candidatus Riflebacteria bacterium]|nr:serine/threonine-protein phosphatase [Candidatus Riflebacteria bacterium]